MKKLLFFLIFFTALQARATHIVGGEFELKHEFGDSYTLSLNMYFDDINGSPGAVDASVNASIFSKGTNRRIANVQLGLVSTSFVPYTNIACTIASLRTKRLLYSEIVQLLPQDYSNQEGYYVVWERCCRNNTIDNIVSPGAAGQTFYMEFPAVVRNGQPFINSSPTLFPPLSDYACVNQLFYFDFAGADIDGDSLTYEMVTPLNGFSNNSNPAPLASPGPYPDITWRPGYGPAAQITGSPAININRFTGQLLVQPDKSGLFVFGIKCSEYRNGVKIGEVRRDFQLLVIACPTNDKPGIQVKVPGTSIFYQQGDTLRIASASPRCLDVFLTDTDPNERLSLTLTPLNFTSPLPVLNNTQGLINSGSTLDTLKASLCFPNCFDTGGLVYRMDLVVSDDGCSLPKKDTIQFTVIVEPIPDQGPVISVNPASTVLRPKVGQTVQFWVAGHDPDNDLVTAEAIGRNFDIKSVPVVFDVPGNVTSFNSLFSWKIDCKAIRDTPYQIDLVISSASCGNIKTDTVSVTIDPVYTNNSPELVPAVPDRVFTLPYNQPFTFDLTGTDPDRDWLTMAASGEDFNLGAYGMKFTTSATDSGTVTGQFSWTPSCEAVKAGSLKLYFDLNEITCQPEPQRYSIELRVPNPDTVTFIPANIFTPNNDNLNDFFEMPSLPPDFCNEVFSSIIIYNRWGSEVYRSNERTFKWDGKNVSNGVYYYLIKFREKTYKGTITIVR